MKIILETERLILREFTTNDAEFIVNLLNSPGWLEYIGDRNVKNVKQATDYLLNGPIKSYKENGFGLSLVELKLDKTPIGMCGLLKRDYLDYPDIGFAFLPDYTGKGYAFEVSKATINYANDSLNIPFIMAITITTNKRSINLLERIGLKFIKIISSQTGDEELMLFGN